MQPNKTSPYCAKARWPQRRRPCLTTFVPHTPWDSPILAASSQCPRLHKLALAGQPQHQNLRILHTLENSRRTTSKRCYSDECRRERHGWAGAASPTTSRRPREIPFGDPNSSSRQNAVFGRFRSRKQDGHPACYAATAMIVKRAWMSSVAVLIWSSTACNRHISSTTPTSSNASNHHWHACATTAADCADTPDLNKLTHREVELRFGQRLQLRGKPQQPRIDITLAADASALDASFPTITNWQEAGTGPVRSTDGCGQGIWRQSNGGKWRPASSCDWTDPSHPICSLYPSTEETQAELIAVDNASYLAWRANSPTSAPAAEVCRLELESIVNTYLEATSQDQPFRSGWIIFGASAPVESHGSHGLGTQHPIATYRQQPPALRRLLDSGLVHGIVSGGSSLHEIWPDVGLGTRRSSLTWLPRPMFQIVVGPGNRQQARRGRTWSNFRKSQAAVAWIKSAEPGTIDFWLVDNAENTPTLQTRLTLQNGDSHHTAFVRPAAATAERARSTTLTPCAACDPRRGGFEREATLPDSGRTEFADLPAPNRQ